MKPFKDVFKEHLVFEDRTGKTYIVDYTPGDIQLLVDGHVVLATKNIQEILNLGLKFQRQLPKSKYSH